MSEAAPHGGGKNEYLGEWDEQAHQRAELEAAIVYKTAEVRGATEGILSKYVDLGNKWTWAYYRLPAKPAPGFPSLYNTDREILIIRQLAPAPKPPDIRIFTNELVGPPEQENVLTEDFVLDPDNDSQYFIDVVGNKNKVPELPSFSPIFYIDPDNQPRLFNVRGFPPMPKVFISTEDKRNSTPFGHYSNPLDKLASLDFGGGLLAEVMNEEPDKCGVKP